MRAHNEEKEGCQKRAEHSLKKLQNDHLARPQLCALRCTSKYISQCATAPSQLLRFYFLQKMHHPPLATPQPLRGRGWCTPFFCCAEGVRVMHNPWNCAETALFGTPWPFFWGRCAIAPASQHPCKDLFFGSNTAP